MSTDRTVAAHGSTRGISKPLCVLIAEDTPASRKLLEIALEKCGHRVDVAENGIEAVHKVRNQHYDLVLMDINMPIMDGLQATTVIRRLADPAKSRLPIVAVTALAWPRQREQCVSAGMNGFLPKPLDTELLMSTMERVAGTADAAGKAG